MKQLTNLLFVAMFALTGCALDQPAETPTASHAALFGLDLESLPAFELSVPEDVKTCVPGVFVGCSDPTTAVFCGDDGRSLVTEACDFGCDAEACNAPSATSR